MADRFTETPFDVTANGITVTGTVTVLRKPDGVYFDSTKPTYLNPRAADFVVDYFNSREACTIDRDALSLAVQGALRKGLIDFGIPDPSEVAISDNAYASIDATRPQCALDANKYVSNETSQGTDWSTALSSDLISRAFAAIPDGNGGTQLVLGGEGTWRADGSSTLKHCWPESRGKYV